MLAVTVSACRASSGAGDATAQSAAQFTQAFYDWYSQHDDRLEAAVSDRSFAFGPELLTALKADIDAQSKSPDEIVGLDWDPFTDSQDPCDPYKVTGTDHRGDTVRVALTGTCEGYASTSGPDVLAEVRRSPAGWVFVDFRSPGDPLSLLDHLALLRHDREADSTGGHR